MKTEEALERVAYLQTLVEETRVRAAYSWPYFLLWGAIVVGIYLSFLLAGEAAAARVTLALLVAGSIGSVLLGLRESRRTGAKRMPALMKRLLMVAAVVVIGGNVAANALLTMRPAGEGAYPAFLWGLVYVIWGIFIGWELVAIGGWIVVASLVSTGMGEAARGVWLTASVGGGMILTGFLLRRSVRHQERAEAA